MDQNLMKIIKKEKERMEYENYNYLRFSNNLKIKVENGSDVCLQSGLSEGQQKTFSCDDIKKETQSCSLCSGSFIDSYSLYKHNLTHLTVRLIRHKFFTYKASPNKYKINDKCGNYILNSLRYRAPFKVKLAGSFHKCGACNKILKYNNWYRHIRNVHGCPRAQCGACKKFFKCKSSLSRHILRLHNGNAPAWGISSLDEPIQCPKCPTKLKSNSAYKGHMLKCHSDEKFQCKICKSFFKYKSRLYDHMESAHYEEGKKLNCDTCGKVFDSPRYLSIHKKCMHTSNSKTI